MAILKFKHPGDLKIDELNETKAAEVDRQP